MEEEDGEYKDHTDDEDGDQEEWDEEVKASCYSDAEEESWEERGE